MTEPIEGYRDGSAANTVLFDRCQFHTQSIDEIVATHYPEPAPIVHRLLLPGNTTLMVGRQKEGKSMLMLQLAIDIGWGGLFLEEYKTNLGKVLYIDFENQGVQIQKRLIDLRRDRAGSKVFVTHFERASAINRGIGLFGENGKRLGELISEHLPEVLVIDPLRYAAVGGGKNNEESGAMAVIDAVAELSALNPKMATLIIHHLRKAQDGVGQKLRDDPRSWIERTFGSQALIAHVDNIWGLAAESEGFTFATVPRSHAELIVRMEKRPGSEKFLMTDDALEVLTPDQRIYWTKLPQEFTWAEGIACGVPKSSLNRLTRAALAAGTLREQGSRYVKKP
jgi:hypothetical protein